MEHLKKINYVILIMLLLATQIQAQVNLCDSITYWTDQGQSQGLLVGIGTMPSTFDSTSILWQVCDESTCYSGSGVSAFFGQITTSDTIKVCYDIMFYTANTLEVCAHCDWLIYNGFSWVLFNNGNTVGIRDYKNKIVNNKMYDLYGREILKPKGLYIQNNKLNYVK
tara:strand:+ start:107 stop:607 length:501 start_codon:yes stop_codon:yes gene_type:complete